MDCLSVAIAALRGSWPCCNWGLGSLGERVLERMRIVVDLLEALDAEGKLLPDGQADLDTARKEIIDLDGL